MAAQKVLLLGDGGVGKTAFVKAMFGQGFSDAYIATLGVEVNAADVNTNIGPVRVAFWDTAGQEKFGGLRDGYYIGGTAAMIFTSGTHGGDVANWRRDIGRVCGKLPVCYVSTKHDCDGAQNRNDHMDGATGQRKPDHFDVSAKTRMNILNPLSYLLRQLMGMENLVVESLTPVAFGAPAAAPVAFGAPAAAPVAVAAVAQPTKQPPFAFGGAKKTPVKSRIKKEEDEDDEEEEDGDGDAEDEGDDDDDEDGGEEEEPDEDADDMDEGDGGFLCEGGGDDAAPVGFDLAPLDAALADADRDMDLMQRMRAQLAAARAEIRRLQTGKDIGGNDGGADSDGYPSDENAGESEPEMSEADPKDEDAGADSKTPENDSAVYVQYQLDAEEHSADNGELGIDAYRARMGKRTKPFKAPLNQFKSYIMKVLKQVHPCCGINAAASQILNDMLVEMIERLVKNGRDSASRILTQRGRKTNVKMALEARDVQTAVRMLFPGELAKHAVSEGTKAVTKFTCFDSDRGTSKSAKAGLQWNVPAIRREMDRYVSRDVKVGVGAEVYLSAVTEYIAAEILELSGNAARDNRKTRITPRHLVLAIKNDEELARLFRDGWFPEGGVLPNIMGALLPKRDDKSRSQKKGADGKTLRSKEILALRSIRREQKSVDLCIHPLKFQRLCREIAQDYRNDNHFTPEALKALQVAAESHLLEVFEDANLAAVHDGRDKIQPKDIQMARRLRRERF